MTPLLQVEHLRVEFPTRRGALVAVDDVSFTIAPGEVLGVVGESGAGKSLTGAAIIGLLEPPGRIAGGEIRLAGRRIDNLPPEEMRHVRGREIGAIFQDPLTSLNPLYTIGRQLDETIQVHTRLGHGAARARALQLLKEVGIPAAEQRIDQFPHQFSGGMRQRVVIALALAANPRLIIADEPTTALDVSVQAQILNLMKDLQRALGLTYLFISHNLAVVSHVSDRVGVMYLGRLVEVGDAKEIFRAPRHPYTRLLLETIPDLKMTRRDREPVAGEVPNPIDPPKGCAFHPRCPYANERCQQERPELTLAGGVAVACHAVEEGRI
jgi:peptide/nickel transport system ATP-binding protein